MEVSDFSGIADVISIGYDRAVAPLAGAWIETGYVLDVARRSQVAPLAGAWIETRVPAPQQALRRRSRPSRARGLKLDGSLQRGCWVSSRPSRARGLKQQPLLTDFAHDHVAPLAGAWIETTVSSVSITNCSGRAPRGRVD